MTWNGSHYTHEDGSLGGHCCGEEATDPIKPRAHSSEELVRTSCGATASRKPRFDLIPLGGLTAVADRFELGLEKHSKNNWRKGIGDRDWCIARLNHVINHALTMIGKLEGQLPDDGDDDAGAIAWGGIIVSECSRGLLKSARHNDTPDAA